MSVSSNASSASSSVCGANCSNEQGSSALNANRIGTSCDSSELADILNRRQEIIDAQSAGIEISHTFKFANIYTEFSEFSRKQIKEYQKTFNKYDTGHDGYLDLNELKYMMEKLGAPQTHLGLKQMIREVDEDHDGKISFREFLLIYRKAQAGELNSQSGLNQLTLLTEIDVEAVGVTGAKNFFEAKIAEKMRSNKFHDEIRQEREERRRQEEEKAIGRLQFQQRSAIFQ